MRQAQEDDILDKFSEFGDVRNINGEWRERVKRDRGSELLQLILNANPRKSFELMRSPPILAQ